MLRKYAGLSLVEVTIAAAVSSAVVAIFLPVVGAGRSSAVHPASNCRRVALASLLYTEGHDQRFPLMINGQMQDLVDTRDGELTAKGNKRTDGWPLVLLPYVRHREAFVDPVRTDTVGIWRGPALATQDAAYDALKNTYRGQSRFPMVGVNYVFLSPIQIPQPTDSNPTSGSIGHSRSLDMALDPAATVFYMDSSRFKLERTRGFWGVNAPGMWAHMSRDDFPYLVFWGGSPCSGDWCGDDDPITPGDQRSTSSAYFDRTRHATVTFLDGRAAYMSDVALAAGTNFLTAKPHDCGAPGSLGAGAVITDESNYLWNLDDDYYE